jgi:hypothetical protein
MGPGNDPNAEPDSVLDAQLAAALAGVHREAPIPPVPDRAAAPVGPDPIDAVLEQEFGVYVQAASAPPPVPAFDESTRQSDEPAERPPGRDWG